MILYEIYIVKEDNFTNYSFANDMICKKIEYSTDGLEVIVNKKVLIENKDYSIENRELFFLIPLSIGDKIIIKASISNDVKVITKNSYSNNALFKYYSSNVKFKSNQKYTFTITINKEEHSFAFMSKYNPFYSTIEKIRMDTGDLLNSVTDEQIANVIHSNSKIALEKLEVAIEAGTKESTVLTKIPTYVKDYVRYKTNIDFCYSIYLSMSGKIGSVSKTIGDIKIDTTYKIPYLGDMLSRFKELLSPNQELLNNGVGSSSTAVSFVKAQNTSYPVSTRGVF